MKTNVLCHTALKPLVICMAILTFNINQAMSQEKITQTAGRTQLGEFAPEFAELNDDILFGQVWNSPGLCPHDRSMVTIATLVGNTTCSLQRATVSPVKKSPQCSHT